MASPRFGCNDGFTLAARMTDRRGCDRRTPAARLVQVAHDGDAAYARCRDLSDAGMKLDLTAPLELNAEVTVSLSPTVVLCGTVVWVSGRECGIAFDGPVDSSALLDSVDAAPGAGGTPSTLTLLGGRSGAQAGPRLPGAPAQARVRFEAGLAVTIMTGPNEERRGMVRWARDNIAALEFTDGRAAPHGLLPKPEGD
ncbi:MAG: PilZ domain-containing protein [Novosphingobium sp.]